MNRMKPSSPDPFGYQGDAVNIKKQRGFVHRYFIACEPELHLNDQTEIQITSRLLNGTSSNPCCTKLMSPPNPHFWEEFNAVMKIKLIPFDNVRKMSDKVQNTH